MKIAYVILHYHAFEMTCECVDHILKIANKNSEIIVVDNCSENGSGRALEQKYMNCDRVHIILNDENKGFANGNNVGYLYAKKQLFADIIVDINNDVIIDDVDFEKKLYNISQTKIDVAVVAPKIFNLEGKNQNPYRVTRLSTARKVKSLISYCLYLLSVRTGIMFRKTYLRYNKPPVCCDYTEKEAYGIVPHGSCMIYMPLYVRKVEFAFVPITFFYGEEDILYDYMRAMDLQSYYTEQVYVTHKEKVATKAFTDDVRKREMFLTKSRVKSIARNIIFRVQLRSKKYINKLNGNSCV